MNFLLSRKVFSNLELEKNDLIDYLSILLNFEIAKK